MIRAGFAAELTAVRSHTRATASLKLPVTRHRLSGLMATELMGPLWPSNKRDLETASFELKSQTRSERPAVIIQRPSGLMATCVTDSPVGRTRALTAGSSEVRSQIRAVPS